MTSIHLSTAVLNEVNIIKKRNELKKQISVSNKIETALFTSLISITVILLFTF
jgi:hypothetical protein